MLKNIVVDNSFENIANDLHGALYKDEDLPSVKIDTIVDYDYNFRKFKKERMKNTPSGPKKFNRRKDKLKIFSL